VRLLASLGCVLLIAACGGGTPSGIPGVTGPATTTPAPAAIWPLRGIAARELSLIKRRPLVVKVANDPNSRPQTGLNQADLIIEIPVEGNITRLAVVYHSEEPSRVGPVRSARQSDLNYLSTLKAILVHVGASEAVAQMVRDAAKSGAFVDVDEFQHPEAFERTTDKPAPYNTYTSGAKAREAAGAAGRESVEVPALPFEGNTADAAKSDKAADSVVIPYPLDSQRVKYDWNNTGGYRRTQGGQPTTDGGKDVLPSNIVIIKTDVKEIPGTADAAGAPSVDFRATGTGPLIVFTRGKRFEGTWSRQGTEMYTFADASGKTIALLQGLTWIHIVPTTFDIQ
jgi:hypothetical protein